MQSGRNIEICSQVRTSADSAANMPDKMIKAVLFDLGETLLTFGRVDTTRLFREGARLSYDFLKSLGQPVGSFELYCWRSLMGLYLRKLLSGVTRRDFDSLAVLERFGTRKGVNLDPGQWKQFAWLWYEPLTRIARIEPETARILTMLKERGLKLGIVSNTFVNAGSLEKHLEQLGLLDFFSVRLYSCEFRFRKPDTQIFRIAAERIGEMFENILFVGDRIDNDIRPAVKAGMRAVLKAAYTNIGKRTPAGAWRIDRLRELPALIEKINAETAH